jgi:hypothetical protein
MQSDLILHLDMDGVLTDFESAFKKIAGGVSPDEYKAKHGKKAEAELFLSKGMEFWRDATWLEGGKELVSFALSHFKLVRILSSAGSGKDWAKFKEIQAGKIMWIQTNVPQIQKKNIIIVPFPNLKARHSGPGRVLVDDRDTTIKQWNMKGGIGILHHHFNWQATIKELESYAGGPIKLKEIVESI